MASPVLIDKALFLQAEFVSAVVNWNRLEGRPRREDFARSLKAEVRDPLWALCRQWQFGEFRGENTGSAIKARLQMRVGRLDTYAPADDVARPYDDTVPLEVRVEREPMPMALGIRVQIGRHFSRLLGSIWSGEVKDAYLDRYRIEASTDPERAAQLASDTKARAYFSAVESRVPDGRALLDDIWKARDLRRWSGDRRDRSQRSSRRGVDSAGVVRTPLQRARDDRARALATVTIGVPLRLRHACRGRRWAARACGESVSRRRSRLACVRCRSHDRSGWR